MEKNDRSRKRSSMKCVLRGSSDGDTEYLNFSVLSPEKIARPKTQKLTQEEWTRRGRLAQVRGGALTGNWRNQAMSLRTPNWWTIDADCWNSCISCCIRARCAGRGVER